MPNHHGPPFGIALASLLIGLVFWFAPQFTLVLYAWGLLPLYGQPWPQVTGLQVPWVGGVVLLQLLGVLVLFAAIVTAFAAFNLWWQMSSKPDDPHANGFADAPFRMLMAAFLGGLFRPLAVSPHPTYQLVGQACTFLGLLFAILYWMRLAEAPRRLQR